jgi:hypothetical protein
MPPRIARTGGGLEAKHISDPPLDRTMILLDTIVGVDALSDSDRLQLAS